MKTSLSTFLLALGLLWALPVSSAKADCLEPQVEETPPDFSSISCRDRSPQLGHIINTGITKGIVKILQGADKTCDPRIDLRYRIDCLRLYYLKVAANLPESGDYLPIRKAMLDAAAKLDAIVTKYEDDMAPLFACAKATKRWPSACRRCAPSRKPSPKPQQPRQPLW